MSDLIESILSRFETVLRYIASGFVALIVFSLSFNGFSILNVTSQSLYNIWVLILTAVLVGFGIYAVQSCIINRFFWFWVVYFHLHCRKYEWLKDYKSKSTFQIMWELDTARWKRRGMDNMEVKAIQKEFDTWSSLLHYIFCTSYCMFIIPLYIKYWHPSHLNKWWYNLIVLRIVLLLFGLYSGNVLTKREIWATKTYNNKVTPVAKKNISTNII